MLGPSKRGQRRTLETVKMYKVFETDSGKWAYETASGYIPGIRFDTEAQACARLTNLGVLYVVLKIPAFA